MNLVYKQLTLSESLNIISNNNYCHMGLSYNNKPYIIPINYSLIKKVDSNNHNNYFFEILCLKNCKKMNIINMNNFVNINVEEALESSVFSVLCYGRVVDIKPYDEKINKLIIKIDYVTGRIISNKNI